MRRAGATARETPKAAASRTGLTLGRGASSFGNTDLEVVLRQHVITHGILIGLTTTTSIAASARHASELGDM